MSQQKKFYYLTGGSIEEFVGKIKFSDFVKEGSNYILSVSDVQTKKEIHIKMSDYDITNITGQSEPKPKLFQLKYYKNGNKYVNIYYEIIKIEKRIPMNGLNGNELNGNGLGGSDNFDNVNVLDNLDNLDKANIIWSDQQSLDQQRQRLRLRKQIHRQQHQHQNKFIQDNKTKFIVKIISLTEEDVLILKTTIKKILKSPIFKQIFEYTDLKENLEHLFY